MKMEKIRMLLSNSNLINAIELAKKTLMKIENKSHPNLTVHNIDLLNRMGLAVYDNIHTAIGKNIGEGKV